MTLDDLEFVILAAGKSTRNYPHSKGIPHKALIPFASRKVIDHIMSEIISTGAKHITIVCGNEEAVKTFKSCFAPEPEIENKFKEKNNTIGLSLLQSVYIPSSINIKYIIQKEPKGLGHCIGLANKIANGRHLAIRLPDDIVVSTSPNNPTAIHRCIKKYLEDDIGGNIFITREVSDPSRWGIIEDGIFKEKPKTSISNEAFHTMAILDKKIGKRLEDVATLIDTEGTEEYNLWKNEKKEIHFNKYLNQEVEKDPKAQKIRTLKLSDNDLYLDCGTIQGYEEALIYSLLNLSVFKERNKEATKKFLNNLTK